MTDQAIRQFFVCEDVRQEVGGKFSLIGLLATEIQLESNFPAFLPNIRIFYELDGKSTSGKALSIKVNLVDADEEIADYAIQLNPSETPVANAVLTISQFPFPQAGLYSITSLIDGKVEHSHNIRVSSLVTAN